MSMKLGEPQSWSVHIDCDGTTTRSHLMTGVLPLITSVLNVYCIVEKRMLHCHAVKLFYNLQLCPCFFFFFNKHNVNQFCNFSQILVLDEATASIDPETEVAVQSTVQTEFKHCTVLTIAHRLSTVASCNRILVMEKGQVWFCSCFITLLYKGGSRCMLGLPVNLCISSS